MSVKTSTQEKEKYTIVTGPLFSHDLDTAAPYTNDIFKWGISNYGWEECKKMYG